MKCLIYLVVFLLIVVTVSHCAAPRTAATQIRSARVRRLEEAEGQ